MQPALALIDRPDAAASLLDRTRLALLEEFREPASAAEAARRLGLPRQRIGYHVRELRKQGLLEEVGVRRKGTATERLVRTTARHYLIAPQVLGALGADPAEVRDRLSSSYLVAVAADAIRSVADLRAGAERVGKKVPTLALQVDVRFAGAEAQHAFAAELADTVARLVRQYHEPAASTGRTFRFAVLGHPRAEAS